MAVFLDAVWASLGKNSLRVDFPGRPIFIQLPPGDGRPRVEGRRHLILHSALLMDRNRIQMEQMRKWRNLSSVPSYINTGWSNWNIHRKLKYIQARL